MELTIEQADIRKAAREFAEGEFRDRAKEFDEKEEFDQSIWKKACEYGFVGTFIKETYGGHGLGFLDHSIICEEFWRVDPGCGQAILSCTFGSEMIQAFGSEKHKKHYLPPLVTGDAIIGFAITEPDAGSDVTMVKTRAEKKGDTYVINGSKMFITNGCLANYILVYAVTHPEGEVAHKSVVSYWWRPRPPGMRQRKYTANWGSGLQTQQRSVSIMWKYLQRIS